MTEDPRAAGRGPADAAESAPFVAANRALWDEWTAIHETSPFYDLDGFWKLDSLADAGNGTWRLPPDMPGEMLLFFSILAVKRAQEPG